MVQLPPSPPPEDGDMAIDGDILETQPDSQVPTQQSSVGSQESQRRTESHLWGYLLPCSTNLKRIDFLKSKKVYQIGRNTSQTVANDFILPGMKISNRHCLIEWDGRMDRGSTVRISDLSSNGTFVNGDKIGDKRFAVLKEGNELAFGTCQPQPNSNEDYRYIYRHVAVAPPPDSLYAHYELTEELGKGSFATVMKAMSRETGMWYACKMIHIKQLKASVQGRIQDPTQALQKEVMILEQLHHPNICQLKEVFREDSYINIILELVPGGDLLDYIVGRNGLSEPEAQHITYQLCDALAYIHDKGIAHRDLKPENVLLTRDVPPIVKVADFGLAKAVDSMTMLKTMCGTPNYLAPEVVTQTEGAGYEQIVDSWSVGVIVFSMLTNTSPFIEPTDTQDVKLKIINRTIDWQYLKDKNASDHAHKFIQALLETNPRARMTLKAALTHSWLIELHQRHLDGTGDYREATASPHSSSQALPDISMAGPSVASAMVVDEDGAPVSSPPNAIPGAYPSSQQPLQRRRKVLDDAREAGKDTFEPTPEMLERARAEDGGEEGGAGLEAGPSTETVKGKKKPAATKKGSKARANGSNGQQNGRGRKRKATSASPMDEDEEEAGEHLQNEEDATTPTEVHTRSRRGRGGAAGGRSRGGQKAASDMGVVPRRSGRTVAAKARR